MKKIIVFAAIAVFAFSVACDNKEKTDDSKPYGTTDTTKMNNINSQADSGHHQTSAEGSANH